ncbi:ATP-binding protein [Thiomicrorhabdus indica]|uniref:ATP-binding protein n=1 Tax=Thiomicrorhabdus indica TaxID=2267253 RepID=UPI002AA744DB|nr:ATP-binding protein [Thiomicrorhabdus indica]
MSLPLVPQNSEFFDIQDPKRILMIGISPGQQYFLSQALDYPGLLIDFARNSHHAQMFMEELGDTYDILWFDEDNMHNGDWEFLKKLAQMYPNDYQPIILQTRPDSSIFKQALSHGVYYFITKPYSEERLLDILSSSFRGLTNFNEINRFVIDYKHSITLFRHAIFHVRTPEDIHSLSATLSYLTQTPEKTSFGLLELMNNALEHGNLGFDFESKAKLVNDGQFESALKKRLYSPEYEHQFVEISVTFSEGFIDFSIRDFGDGFDYESYLTPEDYHQTGPNGRGILIAKNFSFDDLRYEEEGRVAVARTKI